MRFKKQRILKSIVVVFGLLPFSSYGETAHHAGVTNVSGNASQEASNHIIRMHDRVARELAGQQISDRDRQARFRSMLHETFDIERISRFVLGNYWRTANDVQKQTFKSYFEDLLVKTYADSFKSYTGKNFKIQNSRTTPDTGMVLVTTQVDIPKKGAPSEMAPLEIEWRLKQDPTGFKIVDVTVENVSLSITKRQEFGSIIQAGGGHIDALIQKLEQQTRDVRQS